MFPTWDEMPVQQKYIAETTVAWIEKNCGEVTTLPGKEPEIGGNPVLDAIGAVLLEQYNVTLADLMKKRTKVRYWVDLRHLVFAYYLSKYPDMSYLKLSTMFGYHHATLIYAMNRVADLTSYDKEFAARKRALYQAFDIKLYQLQNG